MSLLLYWIITSIASCAILFYMEVRNRDLESVLTKDFSLFVFTILLLSIVLGMVYTPMWIVWQCIKQPFCFVSNTIDRLGVWLYDKYRKDKGTGW